jgi:CRP-like cAMP-binding protein
MQSRLNAVLRALDPDKEKELFAALSPVDFRPMELVQGADVPAKYCYFPLSGLVSLAGRGDTEYDVESGSIGSANAINFGAAALNENGRVTAIAQLPVRAFRVPAAVLRRAYQQSTAVQRALSLAQANLLHHAQLNVLCGSAHEGHHRLARWLLRAGDHSDGGQLEITQEFASQMLGLRRPTISVAASSLRDARVITYARGRIAIRDRAGLEQHACSCYKRAANFDIELVNRLAGS